MAGLIESGCSVAIRRIAVMSESSATAAARAAGRPLQVPGVAGGPKHGIGGEATAVAERRHIGLAEDDGASRAQPLHRDVILLRDEVAVGRRAAHSAQVL